MAYGLGGRVAIVTGGAGGIGREYCRGLAREGCAVVVADMASSEALVGQLRSTGGSAIGLNVDVNDETSTAAMAAAALAEYGRIDVLINNAAFTSG